MRRYFALFSFLLICCVMTMAQIQVEEVFDHQLGPGLAIPSGVSNYTGSMNNYISSQENMLSHKDHQYIAFYNDARKVVVARRNVCGGPWEYAVLSDYTQILNDRHNHVSMGICEGDGTIHLAFDHHAHDLNYRISVSGLATHPEDFSWSESLFSPVRDYFMDGVKETRVTYPCFFSSKDGNLNVAFRKGGSGNGESKIGFYNARTQEWESVHKFVDESGVYQDPHLSTSSTSRNAYHFDFVYDNDNVLHATWVWREGSQSGYNHDIAYAWSPDYGFTWYNNDTVKIGEFSPSNTQYIDYGSPGLHVWMLDSRYGMINNGGQTIDHLNQPHLIARHRIQPVDLPSPKYANGSDGSYFHYWRDTTGTWHQQQLSVFAARTKIYSDALGNLYLPSGSNRLKILVAEASDNWANWTQIYQALPITERNEHHADRNRLMLDGIFSVVSHEFDGSTADGPMHVTDFKLTRQHRSMLQIDPAADAFVRADSFSNMNFGSDASLVVKEHGNDVFDRKIFLRFDLNKLTAAEITNLRKAELVMDVKVGQNTFTSDTYDLFKVGDDSWLEDSITWDNAPDNTAILQSIQGDSAQMRWDLTQEVITEWNADGQLSLSLSTSLQGGNSIIHFFSKEAAAGGLAPKLVITADSSCHQDVVSGYLTNIEREQIQNPLKIFPNPTTGELTLSFELTHRNDVTITIMDLNGKVISEELHTRLSSGSHSISHTLSPRLTNGMYLLRLRVEEEVMTQKIIVSR